MRKKGKKTERLFIIDGSYVIYRAFHAIPSTFTTSSGLPTNAVYGFTQTLRKILKDFSPEYVAVAFDSRGPSFRHETFKEYKAERPPMPDDLSVQIPYIKRMVRAFNIPALEVRSFEADDIMATMDRRMEGTGVKVVLITGDKDMCQLIDSDTVILDYNTGRESGPGEVEEKFGVGPVLIRDLLGLAGDASDNIPGVPGIGPKTAAKLLKDFGSIEGVYENLDRVKGRKLKENLETHREQAMLSRELATLHMDVPLDPDFGLDELRETGPDGSELAPLLKELEFTRILGEMAPETQTESTGAPVPPCETITVTKEKDISLLIAEVKEAGTLALTISTAPPGVGGALQWAAGAVGPDKAFFMPVMGGEGGAGAGAGVGFREEDLVRCLKRVFEDLEALGAGVSCDDSKALHLFLAERGAKPPRVDFDTSIASYLVNPSRSSHTVEVLSADLLDGPLVDPRKKSGRTKRGQEPGIDDVAGYAARKALNIIELVQILDKKLIDDGLEDLYREMELPLAPVLAAMELRGVHVDVESLRDLSAEMSSRLTALEGEIYASAGVEFNINSPKQLSVVLFDTLGLRPVKKTKTGFSTDEEVLTRLAAEHEVPQLIVNFRQLAKLKSTYVDALVGMVNPETGRVHTSFNQTVTATGRLSSSNPNLQNIPVKGEYASRIRGAFVAEPGCVLLSADYSQIELRVVAHLSGDPSLIGSFENGEDIHTRTASEIFNLDPSEVTPELRRSAKAINFGIIYGMGPFGLATSLGIPVAEASDYIENYFIHYAMVKEFIDHTVEEAEKSGYTTTIFGRRRYIPELASPVDNVRKLGARIATNTPVQGSAADIIKAAMIEIDRRLAEGGLSTRMILQIHDELVFEVPTGELEAAIELVRTGMEGVVKLKVPVSVNMTSGPNWSKAG